MAPSLVWITESNNRRVRSFSLADLNHSSRQHLITSSTGRNFHFHCQLIFACVKQYHNSRKDTLTYTCGAYCRHILLITSRRLDDKLNNCTCCYVELVLWTLFTFLFLCFYNHGERRQWPNHQYLFGNPFIVSEYQHNATTNTRYEVKIK